MQSMKLLVTWLASCAALYMVAPVAVAQPSSADLEQRDGRWYLEGEDEPFTGKVSGINGVEGEVVSGLREGRWKGMGANGTLAWVTDYAGGVQLYHAMYYPDGNKRFEGNYAQNRLDGVVKTWYSSGALQQESTYVQGQQHGPHKLWTPAGSLLYSAAYTGGKLNGAAVWWYDDGTERWATYYQNGQRWGVWTQRARDGRILRQSQWKAGKRVL